MFPTNALAGLVLVFASSLGCDNSEQASKPSSPNANTHPTTHSTELPTSKSVKDDSAAAAQSFGAFITRLSPKLREHYAVLHMVVTNEEVDLVKTDSLLHPMVGKVKLVIKSDRGGSGYVL